MGLFSSLTGIFNGLFSNNNDKDYTSSLGNIIGSIVNSITSSSYTSERKDLFNEVVTGTDKSETIKYISDDIQNTTFSLGAGANTLNLHTAVLSGSSITTEDGSDAITIQGRTFRNYAEVQDLTVNMGNGNNTLSITADTCNNVSVVTGDGRDVIRIGGASKLVVDDLKVDTGAGNDSVTIDGNLSGSAIALGEGNDVLHVRNTMTNTMIEAGDGNDTLTFSKNVSDSVIMGGDGKDVVKFAGTLTNTVVDGGEGVDKIVFDSRSGLDLKSNDFSGFEYIDIRQGGKDVLTLQFAELFNDDNIETASLGKYGSDLKAVFVQRDAGDSIVLDGANYTNEGKYLGYTVYECTSSDSDDQMFILLSSGSFAA